jgi:hypothetical protein
MRQRKQLRIGKTMDSITHDDLLKICREIDEKFPKQEFIKALYLTNPNSYLVPRGSFYKTEYKGNKYWLMHWLDFQKIKEEFEKDNYKNENLFIRTGMLGDLLGIPVFQDEEFIKEILIDKFSPKWKTPSIFVTENIS